MRGFGQGSLEIPNMDDEITLIFGSVDILDDIQALWEELNQFHLEKSPYFKQYYADMTFQLRKKTFIDHAVKGLLLVLIAYQGDEPIGYCVASVVDAIGEIDSIYVKPECRGRHVGSRLMGASLRWIKSNNAEKIIIKASFGNDEVFGFYAKYGFAPRLTELQLATKKERP